MFHADIPAVFLLSECSEYIRKVNLARTWLLTTRHVADLNELNPFFFEPQPQIIDQVTFPELEMVNVEIQLDMQMVHLSHNLETLFGGEDTHLR